MREGQKGGSESGHTEPSKQSTYIYSKCSGKLLESFHQERLFKGRGTYLTPRKFLINGTYSFSYLAWCPRQLAHCLTHGTYPGQGC